MRSVYLDYAAATPLDTRVKEAMSPFWDELFYNPSANYLDAKKVKKAIDNSRSKVASCLGAKPTEIIFTAGGTEANNLAVRGVMDANPSSNMVITAIEHESVAEPARQYELKTVAVNSDGIVDTDFIKAAIDDRTVLLSVIYANNEIGTIQPIREIAKILKEIKTKRSANGNSLPLYFHIDACQAPSYLDLNVNRLGVDLMTLNGGKIYGPKQSGVLYIKRTVSIKPLVLGGGQELGRRNGTENVPGIIGFSEALVLAQSNKTREVKRLKFIKDNLIKELLSWRVGVVINGSTNKRLPNNLHITIPGLDNERLLMQLDKVGIKCAAGSACHASSNLISATLAAIGLTEDQARSSLRITMGVYTNEDDAKYFLSELKQLLP